MFLHEGSNCEDLALFFSFFFFITNENSPNNKNGDHFSGPKSIPTKTTHLDGSKTNNNEESLLNVYKRD